MEENIDSIPRVIKIFQGFDGYIHITLSNGKIHHISPDDPLVNQIRADFLQEPLDELYKKNAKNVVSKTLVCNIS